MLKKLPDILTVAQLAEALGICRKAAYTLVNTNQIGHLRVGKTIKIPKFCLLEYIQTARNNVKL